MRQPRWSALGVASLSIAIPFFYVVRFEPSSAPRQPANAVATAVARLTEPGDGLFVWGNEAQLYLLSDRAPSGPYLFLFPLMQPQFTSEAVVRGLLDDWLSDPPTAIVDASAHPGGPSTVPLLGARSPDWPPTDRLDPLREFVRDRYHVETTVDGWPIYLAD